jgi:hypothetical protein
MDKANEVLAIYQKCVNNIEDYLEYRFSKDDAVEVRNKVMKYIDNVTESLKKL